MKRSIFCFLALAYLTIGLINAQIPGPNYGSYGGGMGGMSYSGPNGYHYQGPYGSGYSRHESSPSGHMYSHGHGHSYSHDMRKRK